MSVHLIKIPGFQKLIISTVIAIFLFGLFSSTVIAAVTLVFFRALPGDGEVILIWETATELDNAGFYVNRSNQENGIYQRINPTIMASRGDGLTGAVYEYQDLDVINGTTYWYKLEAIDFGQHSLFYDPVSAIPGLTPTPTASGTAAASPTVTPVPDNSSTTNTPAADPTNFPTATNLPSNNDRPVGQVPTDISGRPESLSTQTPDSLENGTTQDATATLIPFPTLTIEFQTDDDIQDDQADAAVSVTVNTEQGPQNMIRYWPIGVLLIICVLLGGWLLYSRRYL